MNNSNDVHNESLKKILKKKKFGQISIVLNTNTEEKTCEKDIEQNISDFSEIVKTKKRSINVLENIIMKKNEFDAIKKLRKKSKYTKSLNLIECSTNNYTRTKMFEKVSEQNIIDFYTKNNINPKTKSKVNILEYHKISQKVSEQDINDSGSWKNLNQTLKASELKSSDISLENNSSIKNVSVETKKTKKKKKHNKSLNSIELNTNNDKEIKSVEKTYKEDEEPNIINSWNNISQKRKYKINALADTDNVPTKKLKKKKNNDNTSNANHDTEDITYEEIGKQTINDSNTFNCNIDNENVQIKGPKKKKNNKNLNSIELNTNNAIEIKSVKKTYKEDEQKINDSYDNSLNSFEFNTIYDSEISQNHSKLKTLLNSMESNDFEGASTKTETKFNLIKYLKSKEASLQNHPKFKQIKEMLSKKLKDIVNKNCQTTNPDIVLLKTVGNIILEKIVEKMNAAQDINDIKITLPAECKENKIHFIETALCRPPSKEKMNIIKKLNPHVKLRVFNIEEDNLIREYWSKFQREYKISNILPFLSNGLEMVLNNTQKLQFVRYISAGLPNRLLSSVFHRFNILFNGNQDKTRFSEEEDQLIMKVEKCDVIKRKLSVLSLILNRSRMQLYRRHGVLKNQFEKCKKVCWDDQKRQELFTNILLETNTDNWKDLKNLTLKKNTLIKIAENLGEDVTFEKVRKQWNYLYTMLFCEKPIKMLSLRLKILKLLEQQNFKHFSDVNWIKITNKLYPGANSKLICDFFHEWIDKNVPSNIKKNIKDTLNYLREHNVDKIRKEIHKHGEREFPRLTVQDYDLLVVIDE